MKTLTTQQQLELQSLLASLDGLADEIQSLVDDWANELKPKRIRRKETILIKESEDLFFPIGEITVHSIVSKDLTQPV